MGLLQEQGFVKLHTAALLLKLDPQALQARCSTTCRAFA
jgi:hypothetical protein